MTNVVLFYKSNFEAQLCLPLDILFLHIHFFIFYFFYYSHTLLKKLQNIYFITNKL